MEKLHIGSIVVNVNDLERSVAFWTAALGLEAERVDDDWATLRDPDRPGIKLALQLTDQPKTGINRLHLDLYSNGRQQEEVARLEKLGATRPDWNYPSNPDFVVMADPDGNEFCVIE